MPVALDPQAPGSDLRMSVSSPLGTPSLTLDQRRRADQLINVFENADQLEASGTPEKIYDYCQNIHDGRGYTAGWAGFTTATGDALEVVERYARAKPGNALEQYLPVLRRLATTESSSTNLLTGYPDAWKGSALDPVFQNIQDDVVDENSFQPAMARAQQIGAQLPLTKVALYEACIMHGDGDDPDGLDAIMDRATKAAGGTPKSGVNESAWLEKFLELRKADLEHAHDPQTRSEWKDAVGRADVMLEIFRNGNLDLRGPIAVNPFGTAFTIP
jgi:chitosanase